MDVNPGSAPSRQDRRERFLGVLLLGAVRLCCRLFAALPLEPARPIAVATPGVRGSFTAVRPALAGHEDRGPPAPLA